MEKPQGEKPQGQGLLLIGVGTILSSMAIAGFALGYVLDVWADTRPLFMLLMGALGVLGGFIRVFKLLTRPDQS